MLGENEHGNICQKILSDWLRGTVRKCGRGRGGGRDESGTLKNYEGVLLKNECCDVYQKVFECLE